MMEEDDEDTVAVEDVEHIAIRASVFEAYSRQKSSDAKKRKSAPSAAATLEQLENALGSSPPRKSVVKKKEDFGLKLKKYFASKLSETTTGQGIIQTYISDRGQTVIKALCQCMLKFSGRDIARVMRRYVYKLASKFGILYAEKIIGEDKLNSAREPVLVLAFHLMNHLNRDEDDRRDPAHISGLKALVSDAYEALLPLCTDLTGQTNTERLRVVYEYLTKGEFLNFFLCSPSSEPERRTISGALELEVEDTQGDAESTNRVYRQRIFSRKNVLSGLLGSPSLPLFIKSSETSKLVIRYMAKSGGDAVIHCLAFALEVEDYTKQTSRAMVAARGQAIYEKYFAHEEVRALPVPPVIVEEIESKVNAEVFPMNLFWDAYSTVLQSLEGLFMDFLGSQEYSVLQLELRKLEKRLHVLAQLSGVSDESFMVQMSNDRRSGPRKQSIHNDDLLRFDKSGSPKRPGSLAVIAPLELPSPLAPGRKASSGTAGGSGVTDTADDSLRMCSFSSADEEDDDDASDGEDDWVKGAKL